MAKLPSSFRTANRTTCQFRELFAKLPLAIQNLTRQGCVLFDRDPYHPSFRRHELADSHRSQHQQGSISISINMQYRALYVVADDGMNVWYWIGSHADYDRFTGKK